MIAIVNREGDFERTASGSQKLIKTDSRLFKKLVTQGYTLEHSAYRHQTIPTGKVHVLNRMQPEIEYHYLRGKAVVANIGSKNYLKYKSQGKIMVPTFPTKSLLIFKFGSMEGQPVKDARGKPIEFTLYSNKIEALVTREFLREPEVLITKPIKKTKEFDSEPASMFPKDLDVKEALTSKIDTSMITDKEKVYKFVNMAFRAHTAGHKHIIFTISSPNTERPMYYTVKLSSLLRDNPETGEEVWDTPFAVTRIKEFMAQPAMFKKQTMYVRVREHLREKMQEAKASIGAVEVLPETLRPTETTPNSTEVVEYKTTEIVTPTIVNIQEVGGSKAEIRRVILTAINEGASRLPDSTLMGKDLELVETCHKRLLIYIRSYTKYGVFIKNSRNKAVDFGFSVHTMRAVFEGETAIDRLVDDAISIIYQANRADVDVFDSHKIREAYRMMADIKPLSETYADIDNAGYTVTKKSEIRSQIETIKNYLASKNFISLHFYLRGIEFMSVEKFENNCSHITQLSSPFNFSRLNSTLLKEFEQFKSDPHFIKMEALLNQMFNTIKFDASKLKSDATELDIKSAELQAARKHPWEFREKLKKCESERGKILLNIVIKELDYRIYKLEERVQQLQYFKRVGLERVRKAKGFIEDRVESGNPTQQPPLQRKLASVEDMFITVPFDPTIRNIGAWGSDVPYDGGDADDCDYVEPIADDIPDLDLSAFDVAFEEGLPADDPAQPIDTDMYDFDFSDLGAVPFAEQVGDDALPIFYQINANSTNKNSCFADSLRHYGLSSDRLGFQSLDDIKAVLMHMNINYVIYNNKFDCEELEDIKDSLATPADCKARGIPHKVFMKMTAKGSPTDFRRLTLEPEIIDSRVDCEGPEYKFAIAYGVNDSGNPIGHIFVPREIEYFSKGNYTAVYRVAKKTEPIMTEVTKLGTTKAVRYIYYDIECNESHINRKFECNGVSITTFDCQYDMCQLSEAELIEEIRGTTTNYIRAGRNDDLDTIEPHPNPLNIYVKEINLANIISSFLKPGVKNIVLSFNGAGFDNIFLLQDFMKNKQFIEVSAVGGLTELRSPIMAPIAFITQDVKRLAGWVGALQEFTQTFIANKYMHKIANKELFAEMNEYYRTGTVLSNRDFVNRFVAYNNLDTESLLLCHARIMRELTAIMGGDKGVERLMSGCVSLAQFAMKVFQRGLKGRDLRPKKFALPSKSKLSPEEFKKQYDTLVAEYELIKAAKVGGRCQCKPTVALDTTFHLASLDVASLYPFVMMCYKLGLFMAGTPVRTSTYKEGCPGVYFGIVTQTLRNNEMPYFCNKTELGNDWAALDKPIKCVITSYEIEHILKNKPHWRYQILFGYYTEQSIRGLDMFASIKPYMLAKAHEDLLKVNKDPAANNGIREMAKAVMNSLSGKFLQAVRPNDIKMGSIDEGLESARMQLDKYTMREDEYLLANIKKDKMLHIGCSIYSLSKIYMYKNVYSIGEGPNTTIGWDQFVYTDTDSNKITDPHVFSEWMRLRGNVSMADQVWPDLLTPEFKNLGYTLNTPYFYAGEAGSVKCMGQLEDEYQGKGYTNGIYCDKKEYLVWSNKGKYCAKIKGINCKRIVVLDDHNMSEAFDICYKLPGSKKRYSIAEGYNMTGGFWECKVSPEIYEDKFWELNNFETSGIVDTEARGKVDPLSHIENIKKLMLNKRAGKKSFVLMKVFKRSILKTTVRNEFIIKQI